MLTEKGEVYVFKIEERMPERDIDHFNREQA